MQKMTNLIHNMNTLLYKTITACYSRDALLLLITSCTKQQLWQPDTTLIVAWHTKRSLMTEELSEELYQGTKTYKDHGCKTSTYPALRASDSGEMASEQS
jgi:hypothetical protein